VACLPLNDNCPQGFFCNPSTKTCAMGCQKDVDCKSDGGATRPACCDHLCVDENSDNAHCGGCNTSCGQQPCCAGFCSDITNDLANCGMCGHACAGGNANWSCMQSSCVVATCKTGFGDCNMMSNDGCEANFASDVANCGGCGKGCAAQNATVACSNMT